MSSPRNTVLIGYEIGTGAPVQVPICHTAVAGQTQASGKTTTLEAMVSRSGMPAVSFITKRGEGSFTTSRQIRPYFSERADWQFVAAVLEATMRERLKYERAWIVKASREAKTLSDVQTNVQQLMTGHRPGMAADMYMMLNEYLQIVVPQIEQLEYTRELDELEPGVANVMDLSAYSTELQSLVIRSVLEWVYTHLQGTLVVIPEAWEFIPQSRGSPVKMAAENLIRKGGALHNFMWLDSQDLAVVHKDILRSIGLWILGVQREANEVKRTLQHITGKKPKADDVMTLRRGEFIVCSGSAVTRTYVCPSWMIDEQAAAIAKGAVPWPDQVRRPAPSVQQTPPEVRRNPPSVKQPAPIAIRPAAGAQQETELMTDQDRLAMQNLTDSIERLNSRLGASPGAKLADAGSRPTRKGEQEAPAAISHHGDGTAEEVLYERFRARLLKDPVVLKVLATKPEIEVTVQRITLETDSKSLRGRLALLISDGFFDKPTKAYAAFVQLERRGGGIAKASCYVECKKLAADGFLFAEGEGYQKVPGCKITRKG